MSMMSKMQKITMSEKGQIAIPANTRRKYGIQKGTQLQLIEEENGIKLVPPANLVEMCGTWKGLDMKKITAEIEEMRAEDEDSH